MVIASTGQSINNGVLEIEGAYRGGAYAYGTAASATNYGTLSNAGTLTINGDFNGTGSGAVLADPGVLTNTGLLTVDGGFSKYLTHYFPGTLIVSGVLSNTGGIVLQSGGSFPADSAYYFGAGAVLVDAGSLLNAGSILVAGGAPPSLYSSITAATLDVSGVLMNQGTIDLQRGTYSGNQEGAGAQLLVAGTLTNDGELSIDAGSVSAAIQASATISASGLLSNSGTIVDSGTLTGDGTLVNMGFIKSENGVSTGDIAVGALLNDGTIDVAPGGAVRVDSAISAAAGDNGILGIAAHATLTLNGAVASSQEASFIGVHSTLALGDASAFAGVISGLAPQTTIDFLRLDVTSATTSGTTLAIGPAAGGTLDFTLSQPLASYAALSLKGDGFGGTDLLVIRTAAAEPPAPSSLAASPPAVAWADDGRVHGPSVSAVHDAPFAQNVA